MNSCQPKRSNGGIQLPVIIQIRQITDNSPESTRFSYIVCIMRILIQNLMKNKVSTLREIYYHDVDLFHGKQINLNQALNQIASSMGVKLDEDLQVHCSQKGLIYGGPSLILKTDRNKSFDLRYEYDCLLIPQLDESEKVILNKLPKAIIVFEKEAVFRSFCHFIKRQLPNPCLIIITAKGYPDRSSKRFLHLLGKSCPAVPILGFMDSDVYGLGIFWSFLIQNDLSMPNFRLKGVFLLEYKRGWITISKRDYNLTQSFLKRNHCEDNSPKAAQVRKELLTTHRELTRGLLLFKKAEMNVLSSDCQESDSDLNEYVWSKLREIVWETSN